LLGLGINDLEAGVGQLLLVVEGAGFEKRGALGGHEKAGAFLFQPLVGGFRGGHGHAVGEPGAATLFDEKAKALLGVLTGGELPDPAGGGGGELNPPMILKFLGGGVKEEG